MANDLTSTEPPGEKRSLYERDCYTWALQVLLEHLLKWQFQANRRSRGWRTAVAQQRLKIGEHRDENPGLESCIPEMLAQAYMAARLDVTGRFLRRSDPRPAESCPRTFEQVMDEQFWPD
jgi:Domain of unknown function DUF29